MGTTLVVNPGSSSKKYALYSEGVLHMEVRFEDTGSGFESCVEATGSKQVCEAADGQRFESALQHVSQMMKAHIESNRLADIATVVVRVVAPGTYFQTHAEITDEYVKKLHQKESSAPLHIPAILREIVQIKKIFQHTPIVAASDSAFHKDIPKYIREYSFPANDIAETDIHRFGYHGLSVASIVRRIHALIGQDPEKMIVCHIGSGISVTAVLNGKSIETSMGFAPSTDLIMGSRGGDIDAAALLEMMKQKNLKPAEAEMYLNRSTGLQAMAGDADLRHLLERCAQKDETALVTMKAFTHAIQKRIAASTVALGGLDVLVFTATAATRSSTLRSLIVNGLKHLGMFVNEERNSLMIGKGGVISARNSAVKVVVMRTDEMGEMSAVADEINRKVPSLGKKVR